jgi:hypothetical protein
MIPNWIMPHFFWKHIHNLLSKFPVSSHINIAPFDEIFKSTFEIDFLNVEIWWNDTIYNFCYNPLYNPWLWLIDDY